MDPFVHHPGLKGRITLPEDSAFRHFRPADLDPMMASLGHPPDWRFTDTEREARRMALLGPRLGSDLWIFAYGSLMWDPAFHFAELRIGHTPAHERRFCLLDTFGARGQPDAPGLQAALVPSAASGRGCTGLVFRIAAAIAGRESDIVWRREGITDTYDPRFLPVTTDQGQVEALAFVANPQGKGIALGLPHAQQVQFLATGRGRFGTSRAYLENLASQLAALGIDDPEVTALLAAVHAYPA
jgi:cation transport protein ChaC